jgi:signal transduction histidine kinase
VHKLLQRQLKKYFGQTPPSDGNFDGFLAAVGEAYRESDEGLAQLERAIELTSTELVERNQQLRRELDSIQRLELELRQAEKLRAVGQLAAGVAHEINTPIQYVGDSVHFIGDAFGGFRKLALALRQAEADSADPEAALASLRATAEQIELDYLLTEVPLALEQTTDGVRRVAAIVAAMKDFGRPDTRDKVLVDVNRCVESTLLVAQNELKRVADVEATLGDCGLVPGFPGELSQVVLNLLINAAHAVAERYAGSRLRGSIRVRTERHRDDVQLSVQDDGNGISPEIQGRIFEPFFTTKAVGTGTGQGLAIAHAIVVEKHGGSLRFESTPGQGSTFVISIPTQTRREARASEPGLAPCEAQI